jgi:hypothetical protein
METFENRLRRFLNTGGEEIPLTLLVWGQNTLLDQLKIVRQHHLDDLIFLSIHAFMQTFSETVFDKAGLSAPEFFLSSFMDGTENDKQFSLIAPDIHEMRNVMAHRVFSSRTHNMAINYTMAEGWKKDQGLLHVNPEVFASQFEGALNGGRLWKWRKFTSNEDTVRQKYRFICRWLDLPKSDLIAQQIATLTKATTMQEIERMERPIKQVIEAQYKL